MNPNSRGVTRSQCPSPGCVRAMSHVGSHLTEEDGLVTRDDWRCPRWFHYVTYSRQCTEPIYHKGPCLTALTPGDEPVTPTNQRGQDKPAFARARRKANG